jgi:3-hydroxyisobutyrate dehydrogenase-like beta-hydroxyacid dehydrogenase
MKRRVVYPSLFIDCSTSEPTLAEELADVAKHITLHPSACHNGQAHPMVLDAPVSGGVPGAQAATLTCIAGGEARAVEAARPILIPSLGRHIIHCGPSGRGQVAKLANNLVMGISMAAVAEGLALGQALGISPRQLTDVFNSSSARCWSSEAYNPAGGTMPDVPSSRSYSNGFSGSLMVKDLGLALDSAAQCKMPLPLTEKARSLYGRLAKEAPGLDFSAIFQLIYKGRPEGAPPQ